MAKRSQGSFPSNEKVNLRETLKVISLRSGKELPLLHEKPSKEKMSRRSKVTFLGVRMLMANKAAWSRRKGYKM